MINLEDILLDSATCELSRVALSTPHEFQRRLDSQYLKQERRRFHEIPEQPSAFGFLYPDARSGRFPDAADVDLANRSAL